MSKQQSPPSNSVKVPLTLPDSECLIYHSVPLAGYTSYKVGGDAQWYVEPKTQKDLEAIFAWVGKRQIPFTCIGKGSNLLISDQGIEGLVINSRYWKNYDFIPEEYMVKVGAGYSLPKLAWQMAKKGWRGLEWAVGIPATVGGAVVMNAGAHKGCMSDVLLSALVAYSDGEIAELTNQDLKYSYRTSILQQKQAMVISATLKLQGGETKEEMMLSTNKNFQHRKNTQPYDKPSCGSVFRNPDTKSAGWLIEQTGLKGYQIGNAQVSHRHANFILNLGSANAKDIHDLIYHVQEEVSNRWSIHLHPEVKFIGKF